MNPDQIPLARRIVACGLPRFILTEEDSGLYGFDHNGWTVELEAYDTTDYKQLKYECVVTDTGPELLPVLDNFALLGWLITEARRLLDEPHLRTRWSKSGQRWEVYGDSAKWRHVATHHVGTGDTEVEALVAALEAAKGAA